MRPRLQPSYQAGSRQCSALFSRTPRRQQAIGLSAPFAVLVPKRGITQRHILRMREAHDAWKQQATRIKAGKQQSFLSLLESRGLVKNVVGDRELANKIFTEKRVGLYAGVDPTAPSLHIGHMLPFMILAWAYVHGMKAVFLLGGSTAQIGDPTGRTKMREKIAPVTRKANIVNMHLQLKKLGASIEKYGDKYGYKYEWAWRRAVENNNTWWNKQPFLEIIRSMGRYLRLGTMLGRDSVKMRMNSGDGMSLAEFTYPLMQAWDWWNLYTHDIQVQVGGSDQEGNILFGMDAIKQMVKEGHFEGTAPPIKRAFIANILRKEGQPDPELAEPVGITTPLLMTSSGEKFGKSAGNAVWLDKDMTSTFELYQYFVRTSDGDVEQYLKMFTFVPLPEIETIMKEHRVDPSKRVAQHRLAVEFLELVHGKTEAEATQAQHLNIFSQKKNAEGSKIPQTDLFNSSTPHTILPRSLVVGQFFHKVLWSAGLAASKSEAHRLVTKNGAAVGSRSDSSHVMDDAVSYVPIRTWGADVTEKFIIDDELLILRAGKWRVKIVKIISDEEFEARGLTAPGWKEEESIEQRQEDSELAAKKVRIGGHHTRPPRMAQEGK